MRKARSVLLLVAAVMMAALPALALAQVEAQGSGWLSAQGSGAAELQGSGHVRISGSGTLKIAFHTGHPPTIAVTGSGRRFAHERGDYTIITYRGFNGSALIEGQRMGVRLRGRDINIEAHGTGIVKLKGHGTYTLNGRSGRWTADGVLLRLFGDTPEGIEAALDS